MAKITADRNYANTHVDLFFEVSALALAPDSGITIDSTKDQIFYAGEREKIEPVAKMLREGGVEIECTDLTD